MRNASKILSSYIPELFALRWVRRKPAMVGVNLTNRCNQRCIYCEIGSGPAFLPKQTLTFDDLVWIIDQMALSGIRRLALCGGEPFLFEGLVEVVSYAGKHNIICAITTNGMTAHQLSIAELGVLKECRAEVNISVDSFQEGIQTLTRGTSAALPHALASIQHLSGAGIPVTVLTAISTYNVWDLCDSFTRAHALGVREVLFQPLIYHTNYPDRPAIAGKSLLNVGVEDIDLLMNELRKILQFEKTHPIKSNVYRIYPWIAAYLKTAAGSHRGWFFHEVLHTFYCREIYAIIDIGYDGGIQSCGLLPAMVNVHEDRKEGLLALWEKATKDIREDMRRGRYPASCNACCHHFSRNMIASMIKHPVKNRRAMMKMMPLLLSRMRTQWFH